ncbi:AEC family transporter [Methanobrevibacter sp. 87.7]|uniref:AEC family transporter n=1 Tax=Methanobrevibacter sp. 87.7 TaxID=387957 RepID=UPI000B4FFEB3|nr:AEC family transporter [Methanobrevibacter sp. 87.7]
MEILTTFLTIFIILAIGFIAKRFNLLSANEGATINKVVVYLAMPFLVFRSLYDANMSLLPTLGKFPIIGFISAFLVGIVSYLLFVGMKLPDKQKYALLSVIIMGNTGFVGFPVVMGVYGVSGLVRAIFFNITDVLMMIVVYLIFVIKFGGEYKEVVKRIFSFPVLWGLIIGLLFNLYHIPIGTVGTNIINYLADITIPLIILSLGLSMNFKGFGKKFGLTLTGSVLKLFVYPFFAFFILKLFGITGFDNEIALIEAAMPSAMLSISYVMEFGLDVELTSDIIVFDTLLSLVTLPVLMTCL